MNNKSILIIDALTNMHVGSGDSNYGVIDKLVQRDPVTNYPSIYSSSLKGAFRLYFEEIHPHICDVDKVFGKVDKGEVAFLPANLLSIPLRANFLPYVHATCPSALKSLQNQYNLQGSKNNDLDKLVSLKVNKPTLYNYGGTLDDYYKIEDVSLRDIILKAEKTELEDILGEHILLLSDEEFGMKVSDYSLPVVARNNLENGQSTNLWYEQIIPWGSKFSATIIDMPGKNNINFHNIFNDPQQVQIGANATIGYGLTSIKKIA